MCGECSGLDRVVLVFNEAAMPLFRVYEEIKRVG